jgi:hypothetical protein
MGTWERRNVIDTLFVGSLWPPGNGQNEMDPRFQSLFATFNIETPSDETKKRIYQSILEAHV